jgi:large subunit ribosomal protein L44
MLCRFAFRRNYFVSGRLGVHLNRSGTTRRPQSTQGSVKTRIYTTPADAFNFGAYARAKELVPIPESVAQRSPALKTLHSRLNLPEEFAYSTLARTLICRSANVKFADNVGLANFGKNVLSFYVYEHFMIKYPRLPPAVLKHVVQLYTSVPALAKIGGSWGVESDSRSAFTRYLADQSDEDVIGRLAYIGNTLTKEDGVVQILDNDEAHTDLNGAMSSFVRAVVAGLYAYGGLEKSREFIHKYIIQPRKIDMAAILTFDKPLRELSVLCGREGLERPVSRLMAESGRFSIAPIFVVGVFSGTNKLGEGQGASLREAQTRAAVNALKSWYLYSPMSPQLPSDRSGEFKPAFVDSGTVVI